MDLIQKIAALILASGLVYLILYNLLPNQEDKTVPIKEQLSKADNGSGLGLDSEDQKLAETLGVVQTADGSLKVVGYGQAVATGSYGNRGESCVNNKLPENDLMGRKRSPDDMNTKFLRKLAQKGLIADLDTMPSPGSIPEVPAGLMKAENYLSPYPLANQATVNRSLNTTVPTDGNNTIDPPVGEGLGPNLTTSSVYNPNATGILPKNQELTNSGLGSGPAQFGNNITDIGGFYRQNPDIFDRTVAKVTNPADWDIKSQGLQALAQNQAPSANIYAYNFPELYGQYASCQ